MQFFFELNIVKQESFPPSSTNFVNF